MSDQRPYDTQPGGPWSQPDGGWNQPADGPARPTVDSGRWSQPAGYPQPQIAASGPAVSVASGVGAVQPNTPGWLSRFLLWGGIIVLSLPSLIVMPILMSTSAFEYMSVYSFIGVFAGILALLLAAAAFVFARNTNWARRLIGGGIYVFAGIVSMVVLPLLSRLLSEATYRYDSGVWLTSLVFGLFSAIILASKLVGWCIARNRRWWVLLVAAGCGLIVPLVSSLGQMVVFTSGAPFWLGSGLLQVISLVLIFGALGLLHLLGGLRGGAAPVVAQPTFGESRQVRSAQGVQAGPGVGNPQAHGPVDQAFDQQTFGAQPPNSQSGYAQAQYGGSQPVASQPGYAPPQHGNSQSPARSSEQFRPPQNPGQQPGPGYAPDSDSQRWQPGASSQQQGAHPTQPGAYSAQPDAHSSQTGPSDFQPPRRPRH